MQNSHLSRQIKWEWMKHGEKYRTGKIVGYKTKHRHSQNSCHFHAVHIYKIQIVCEREIACTAHKNVFIFMIIIYFDTETHLHVRSGTVHFYLRVKHKFSSEVFLFYFIFFILCKTRRVCDNHWCSVKGMWNTENLHGSYRYAHFIFIYFFLFAIFFFCASINYI